jgi:hypothetical protein
MVFAICAEEQVLKELIKVIRIEQIAKCAKAASMLKAMMALRYVLFVMVVEKKVINQMNIFMKKKALVIFVILIGLTSCKDDNSERNFTYDEQEFMDELKYSDDYISKTYTKGFDQNKITIILL